MTTPLKKVFATLLIMILTGATANAGDIMIYSWAQELSGDIAGQTGGGFTRGSIDRDSSSETGFRFQSKIFGKEFEFSYVTLKNTTTVDGTFTFEGTNFAGTSNLDIDAKMYEFFPKFNLGTSGGNTFKLLFGLKLIDMNATVEQGANVGEFDEYLPIPQVGLQAAVEFTKTLRIEGHYKWLDLEVQNVDAKVIDTEIALMYNIGTGGDLVVGWRSFEMDLTADEGDADESSVDLKHKGMFFGWRFAF